MFVSFFPLPPAFSPAFQPFLLAIASDRHKPSAAANERLSGAFKKPQHLLNVSDILPTLKTVVAGALILPHHTRVLVKNRQSICCSSHRELSAAHATNTKIARGGCWTVNLSDARYSSAHALTRSNGCWNRSASSPLKRFLQVVAAFAVS